MELYWYSSKNHWIVDVSPGGISMMNSCDHVQGCATGSYCVSLVCHTNVQQHSVFAKCDMAKERHVITTYLTTVVRE